MANYVKATNFFTKDALLTGNPAKIIKGAEIDAEYNAIATAISSKADTTSPTFTGTPTAPTAAAGTNTTQVATTAFVTAATGPFAAGSAGAPSITTSGDTNTGIFFPAADTIALAEGGTEALRINNLGNVTIGTPGSLNELYRLEVKGGNVKVTNTPEATLSMTGGSSNLNFISTNADHAVISCSGNGLGVGITYGSGQCVFDNATSTMQVTGNISATNFVGNATTASNAIGFNQTWKDLSGVVTAGTTYTNSTGRPIFLSVRLEQDDGTLSLTVNGLLIGRTGTTAGPQNYTLTAIIPAGNTYKVDTTGGSLFWYELS